jgi:FKBP-type peptidyl-prolyl cis-trans isomerase FkpA
MKRYILFLATIALAINANAQAPVKVTANGTQYQILTTSNGRKIKLDDIITFHVIQKTGKDSILYSSYTAGNPVQVKVQPEGDLMDIFPLLAEKDSALVKISTDSVFKNNEAQRPPFFPKGSFISCLIKIVKVQSLDEAIAERQALLDGLAAKETADMNKYIADKGLALTTTLSGLKYRITAPSIKRKPVAGDSVMVNYTGRTVEGKVFDSSIEADAKAGGLVQPGRTYEPIAFRVGQGMVIPGWDEGLLLLGEGAKATFVIPSKLAYADRGAGEDIKPFNTLIFDVQLMKVIPAKKPVAKKPLAKAPVKKSTTIAKKPATKSTTTKSTTVKKTTVAPKKKS